MSERQEEMNAIYLLCGHRPDSDVICRKCWQSENAALRAKVEKLELDLSGKTFSCSQCNGYAKKLEKLTGRLEAAEEICNFVSKAHRDCKIKGCHLDMKIDNWEFAKASQ